MNVSVIIPAAGSGKRFGGKDNKIFARLNGQAVFLRTIELFASRNDVCQIILAASPADMDTIKGTYGGNLGFMGVKVIEGGAERVDTVRNALAAVADEADYVAVHDAVRPCVSQVWIDEVFDEARLSGAAILAYPVHGTLKRAAQVETRKPDRADDLEKIFGPGASKAAKTAPPRWAVEETVCRSGLWQAQTPQVFKRELIERAYAAKIDGPVTDDAQLVEALGWKVKIVMGDPRNIKITTPGDLSLAGAVIGSLPKPKPKKAVDPFGEAQW